MMVAGAEKEMKIPLISNWLNSRKGTPVKGSNIHCPKCGEWKFTNVEGLPEETLCLACRGHKK